MFSAHIQEIDMEVFALLFASKYGMAALGSVTLAMGMLIGTFVVLAKKASSDAPAALSHAGVGRA